MTYNEAIEAVKSNVASRPERAHSGGRTAARRKAWTVVASVPMVDYPRWDCLGVIYVNQFVRNSNSFEDSYEKTLMLDDFGTPDTSEWGLDYDARPWYPTTEDLEANDWEIYALWS